MRLRSLAIVLSALPLAAQPEPEAYLPDLTPRSRIQAEIPQAAIEQGLQGPNSVRVLLTLDAAGFVAATEILSGPEVLRAGAIEAVRRLQFDPVIRNGLPVAAYTDKSVLFVLPGPASAARHDPDGDLAAARRINDLKARFLRDARQELEDLERDLRGADRFRRASLLAKAAKAAWAADELSRALAHATSLLAEVRPGDRIWYNGNAEHDGNMVLGLVESRRGNLAEAARYLSEAGKSRGSPTLNSFGPNMTLAKELIAKGEREAVLEYFELCRKFWKMGGERLDKWSATVRADGMPDFGANLLY